MLAEATRATTATVVAALQRASAATGSDFRYLLGIAIRESGLRPQAHSSRSSAAGLFQFVEQTWLGLVKEFGARHGLASYANAISRGADGRFHAPDAEDRHAILALRTDPQISAMMAGEYAKQTQALLQNALGRPVCGGELYAAHLLGPGAACRLIEMNGEAPQSPAADLFPQAADANRPVFYKTDGTPKTVREVYNWAMRQPSMSRAVAEAAAQAPLEMPAADNNYAGLLASMWGPPRHAGFFSTGKPTAASPFVLSPGVLDLLSTVAKDRGSS